ncbi:MAG: right-handed parallel beta-helix repeat-containing protein [Bacteroidetes bacterium]|nr:right-handed parallel beta-helix repeat-containing protein [Bacteroidota bacterium]
MKRKIFEYTILITTTLFFTFTAKGLPPAFLIGLATNIAEGDFQPFNQVQPGDTVWIQSGVREYLRIRDFNGSSDKPIIFMNYGGEVTVNTSYNYGIAVSNCRFVRLTGTGDPANFYGINIQHVSNGAGVSFGELSTDFEMDHIRITDDPIAGLYAKTDPDCSFSATRTNFTQYNTLIHDNYIENTGDEGLYIGSSFYGGETFNCNGKDTVLFPSILSGVRVYNNIVKSTGWDGIQVGSASVDCQVYGNIIMYDSQAEVSGQMSGILLGGGSVCDCYNNSISEGKGDGIEDHGLGGNGIFNNLIIDAGRTYFPNDLSKKKFGIYISDGSGFHILFNDIINPKCDGIRFASLNSTNNLAVSNAIINPGDYAFEGSASYVEVSDPSSEVTISNNYFSTDTVNAGFVNGSYELKSGSPLIDAGYVNNENVDFDYLNHFRPQGGGFDIGAYEYVTGTTGIQNNLSGKIISLPYPNPARIQLTIAYDFPGSSDVQLDIYNLQGTRIYETFQTAVPAGDHTLNVNVLDLPPGIYIYTLHAGRDVVTGKFVKTG